MSEADYSYSLREPASDADWEGYFDLRWRVLRMPWQQPRGSERDELEQTSTHLMVTGKGGMPVAVGRFHFRSSSEIQIRFMAVAPEFVGMGFGSRVLKALETRASNAGAKRAVLNSRTTAAGFYLAHGYKFVAHGQTLFESVEHVVLAKELTT